MKSAITTKTVENTIKVEEKVITLEMTERQAEILYHFIGFTKVEDLVKSAGKRMDLDANMISSDPDAVNFAIYDALAKHFDKYHAEY